MELPHGRALVASLALHGCVSAKERKPVLVFLNRAQADLPSAHGVALRAIGSEFSAMNVRVTIGAILPDLGEHGFYMALRAGDLLMHAAQWIAGFIVIELGDCTDGPPARVGVAVRAGNRQWAVRTSGAAPLREHTRSE